QGRHDAGGCVRDGRADGRPPPERDPPSDAPDHALRRRVTRASAVVALTATLCACSSGPAASSSSTSPNASTKTVVIQAADVQGMIKCPQSDTWARFLLSDQPNGPATVPPKFR